MNDILLKVRNFNVYYKSSEGDVHAVRNVNLDFMENASYGIVGESGSGKTTLVMAILRLLGTDTKVTGDVIYEGVNLNDLKESEFRKYRWTDFSIVFQQAMNFLSPVHKIGKQLISIYTANGPTKNKKEAKEQILKTFKKVNLTENVFNMYPHELSGGMMQRVAISSAILLNPKFLVMDEATTALDIITEGRILDEIKLLEKDRDMTRVMITHDVSVVSSSTERVIVMYGGLILEEGKVGEVFLNPLHPYTKLLLESYPKMNDEAKYLKSIKGGLPDLKSEYKGCVFYDRCPYRKESCRLNTPALVRHGDRSVACFLAEGVLDE